MPEPTGEVKEFVERVVVEPTADEELVEGQETPASSSEAKEPDKEAGAAEGETPAVEPKEQIVRREPVVPKEPAPVEGETPKERALRKEVERVKEELRNARRQEIIDTSDIPKTAKGEQSERVKEVLGKYNPDEINNLKEVFDVMAEDMGFVKNDEWTANNFKAEASKQLDDFLGEHTEYLPENDKENTLWSAFKEEYALYKTPENPKAYKTIFNRIHASIFGGKTDGIEKVNAQVEKKKVASHAGAPAGGSTAPRTARPTQGVRLDMLKGFSQEEINELSSE